MGDDFTDFAQGKSDDEIGIALELCRQLPDRGGLAGSFSPLQQADAVRLAQRSHQECDRIEVSAIPDGDQSVCAFTKRLVSQRGVVCLHCPAHLANCPIIPYLHDPGATKVP